jgi:hypothetical protein
MNPKSDLLFIGSSHFSSYHYFGGEKLKTNFHFKIGQIKFISLPGKYLGGKEISTINDQVSCYFRIVGTAWYA